MRGHLPPLTDERIREVIADRWGVRIGELRYLAIGGGAYHWDTHADDGQRCFVTCDDLDTKPWFGSDHDVVFPGLRAAYRTAIDLRRVGLDFVVAPVASRSGEPAERIDEQHGLSVLPFVDGEAGLWGRPVAQQGREELATMLARLHDSTAATLSAPRRELVVPDRDEFAAQHHQRR